MRVVALTGGTAGDVNPFIGIGEEIVRQGHSFVLCANEYFRTAVENRGLEFEPTGSKEKYLKMIEKPNNWDDSFSLMMVWEQYILPYMDQYLQSIDQAAAGQNIVLLSTPGMIPSIVYKDLHSCPLIVLGFSPLQYDPLVDPENNKSKEDERRIREGLNNLYKNLNLDF